MTDASNYIFGYYSKAVRGEVTAAFILMSVASPFVFMHCDDASKRFIIRLTAVPLHFILIRQPQENVKCTFIREDAKYNNDESLWFQPCRFILSSRVMSFLSRMRHWT